MQTPLPQAHTLAAHLTQGTPRWRLQLGLRKARTRTWGTHGSDESGNERYRSRGERLECAYIGAAAVRGSHTHATHSVRTLQASWPGHAVVLAPWHGSRQPTLCVFHTAHASSGDAHLLKASATTLAPSCGCTTASGLLLRHSDSGVQQTRLVSKLALHRPASPSHRRMQTRGNTSLAGAHPAAAARPHTTPSTPHLSCGQATTCPKLTSSVLASPRARTELTRVMASRVCRQRASPTTSAAAVCTDAGGQRSSCAAPPASPPSSEDSDSREVAAGGAAAPAAAALIARKMDSASGVLPRSKHAISSSRQWPSLSCARRGGPEAGPGLPPRPLRLPSLLSPAAALLPPPLPPSSAQRMSSASLASAAAVTLRSAAAVIHG